jgi:hypothetical protein
MTFEMTVGSRAQVWHGTAKHTSGGLTKSNLMKNTAGRIVSRKKHASAKKENRLAKAGYKTKKGHFGFIKVGSRKRGHKGGSDIYSPADLAIDSGSLGSNDVQIQAGMSGGYALAPADIKSLDIYGQGIDGQGITDYGSMGSVGVQMAAGQAAGSRRRRHRRGLKGGYALAPADITSSDIYGQGIGINSQGNGIDGQGITDYGSMGSVGVQMAAGQAAGSRRRRRMKGGAYGYIRR